MAGRPAGLIREVSDAPVIMMTGKRCSEDDIVRGLECGADEYLGQARGQPGAVSQGAGCFTPLGFVFGE